MGEKLKEPPMEKAENIGQKFFDMAEKNEKSSRLYEVFNKVGIKVNQGNYDKAQLFLEDMNSWDDETRELAVQVNSMERERTGGQNLSAEEAKNIISGYAKEFRKIFLKSRDPNDMQNAGEIERMVKDIDQSDQEGIKKTLSYIEGILKSRANIRDSIAQNEQKNFRDALKEQRNIRDSLWQEMRKRAKDIEAVKNEKTIEKARREEIRRDEEKAKNVRERLKILQSEYDFPEDERGQALYEKNKFKQLVDLPFEEFKEKFTQKELAHFAAYIEHKVKTLVERKKSDGVMGRYPDTVASVLGDGSNMAGILQRIAVIKENRYIGLKELSGKPFTEVSQNYLNLDIQKAIPDYFQHFSRR